MPRVVVTTLNLKCYSCRFTSWFFANIDNLIYALVTTLSFTDVFSYKVSALIWPICHKVFNN